MLVAAYGLSGKDAICDCALGTRADKFVRIIEFAHRMTAFRSIERGAPHCRRNRRTAAATPKSREDFATRSAFS
ncbi:hypothetical protein SAMN05216328_13155 [Ensifer sp. YR511]|nr:hypothetical protein SAMN05216328_13155 [Ensifer sp. YR511]